MPSSSGTNIIISYLKSLRDTLELIDLILETVERFPKVRRASRFFCLINATADALSQTLALCKTARDVKEAFARKKLSVLIGLEGYYYFSNPCTSVH